MLFRHLAAIGLLFISSSFARADEINIAVAKAVHENIFSKIIEPFEKETGIKVKVAKTQPRAGEVVANIDYILDLIEGKVEAASSSGSYQQMVEVMKERNHTMPSEITHRVIGHDVMLIIANKKGGIAKASLDQLHDIFTGKVTNWKQVGGPDAPVTIIIYGSKPGKNTAIRKLVMKDQKYGGTVKEIPGEEEAIAEAVSSTPGAIGFITLDIPLAPDKAFAIETPPIGRPITLYTKGQPSPAVHKLISFIRDYGVKNKKM
jgi:phosphate transport system substrate-binding protein